MAPPALILYVERSASQHDQLAAMARPPSRGVIRSGISITPLAGDLGRAIRTRLARRPTA
jgi:hypothetical protein